MFVSSHLSTNKQVRGPLMKIISMCVINLVLWGRSLADYSENRPPEIFPDDYDKYEPPWKKGNPARVYLQFSIMDVDRIDDGAMEFSIQSYLGESWKDPRLNLSVYQSDIQKNPIFPSYLIKYLWVPDLVFDNTRNGMLFHLTVPNTNVKVMADGSFFRSSRYNLVVGCRMDFHFYPVDTQKCFLKISTMSSPDYKVLLHWMEELPPGKMKSILVTNSIEPLQYILEEPKSFKSVEIWPSGNYTYLYANFTFVRRVSGSLFNAYVPSTLVVFLSWISFWLDIEAVPARVTLGVTSLLTLATQVVQAHSGLPAISYMTGIDVWLFVCLITVFSSLLEFAFAYHMHVLSKQRQELAHQPSPRVFAKNARESRRFFRSRLIGHTPCRHIFRGRRKSAASEKFAQDILCQKFLDKMCRKLFPILFCVFSIVYWIYYLYLK